MKKLFFTFLLSTFFISIFNNCSAQDYKYSQFYNSPLNLNPSFTGQIHSLYRLVANYRLQYLPIQKPAPYNTFSFSGDVGLLRDRLNGDILGVGAVFTNDRQSSIKSNLMMVSLAYQKILTQKKNSYHYLSAGFQFGFTQRRIDVNNLAFESQFTGTGFDLTLDNKENFFKDKYVKPNMNIGLMWTGRFNKMLGAYVGFSMFNIIKAKDTFFASDNERAYRMNAHAGLNVTIKDFVLISPNMMYMRQAKAQQIIGGTSVAFSLNKDEPFRTAVSAGVWYDGNQAVIASAGVSFSGVQIGLSYDATFRKDLSKADKSFGALEASIIYTSKPLEKKKRYSPLLCPNF
jgi:type IX secretion system PorP/SprF family membrane protein